MITNNNFTLFPLFFKVFRLKNGEKLAKIIKFDENFRKKIAKAKCRGIKCRVCKHRVRSLSSSSVQTTVYSRSFAIFRRISPGKTSGNHNFQQNFENIYFRTKVKNFLLLNKKNKKTSSKAQFPLSFRPFQRCHSAEKPNGNVENRNVFSVGDSVRKWESLEKKTEKKMG